MDVNGENQARKRKQGKNQSNTPTKKIHWVNNYQLVPNFKL